MKNSVAGFAASVGLLCLASVALAREVIVSAAPADDKGMGMMDFQICSDIDEQHLKDQIESKLRLTEGATVVPPLKTNHGFIHFNFENGAPGSLVEASLPYEVVHRPRPGQCGGRVAEWADTGAGPKTNELDISQSGKNSEGRMDFPLCCCEVDPRDVRDRLESRIALTQGAKVVPPIVVDDDRMVRVKFKDAKPSTQVELKASSDVVDFACVAAIPVVVGGAPFGDFAAEDLQPSGGSNDHVAGGARYGYYAAGLAVVGGGIAGGVVTSGGGGRSGSTSGRGVSSSTTGTALSPVQ